MLQICNMGPTALLPLRRKACWGFFCPEKSWRLRPGFNLQTWVLKGSMLSLDHWSRSILVNITYVKHVYDLNKSHMTMKTVKWNAFLFIYMSDNTQPPNRAFRGPNAAVTSYVNTSRLWTEVVSFPNIQCCVTVNRLIQFGKIMSVSCQLIYSFYIQEELCMYISHI